jgi:hypothetical protein
MPQFRPAHTVEGRGSFIVVTFAPQEEDVLPAIQAEILRAQGQLWGTVVVGMEGSRVVADHSFGPRNVVVGMTWIAHRLGSERAEEFRLRTPTDIMIDESVGAGELAVLAAFDAGQLTWAVDCPGDLSRFHSEVRNRKNPLQFWTPKPETSLDDAAITVFAFPD